MSAYRRDIAISGDTNSCVSGVVWSQTFTWRKLFHFHMPYVVIVIQTDPKKTGLDNRHNDHGILVDLELEHERGKFMFKRPLTRLGVSHALARRPEKMYLKDNSDGRSSALQIQEMTKWFSRG